MPRRPASDSRTVIILGAGAAGLAACRALLRAGCPVVLLEARQRAGGRADTRPDPALGVSVERGAEFVHGLPPLVKRLAREARAPLLAVPDRHRVIVPRGAGTPGAAFARAQALLSRAEDDGESVQDFLARTGRGAGPGVTAMARSFVEGFYLADPRRASAGAIARMGHALETIGAERSYRTVGGWAGLLAPLTAAARDAGALRLGVRATRVRWAAGRVEVEARGLAGGPMAPVGGARLLVTLPVGVLRAGAVRFSPAPGNARAWARLEMGPVVKVLLRFRRPPFDPARGPTFLHLPGAPVPVFWTQAPRPTPLLIGWAGGPRAVRLSGRPAGDVVRAALRGLAPAFRLAPGALEDRLEGAEVIDWSADPLAGGGYAVFPPGSAGVAEALARPVQGTLFFAGEATEPDFAGTVDGALRSGERAAREVLASLQGPRS